MKFSTHILYNYKSNISYNSINIHEDENNLEMGKRNIINPEFKSSNLLPNYNNNIKYQSNTNNFDISQNNRLINKILNNNSIISRSKKIMMNNL